jgi:hypothetical protein
MQITVVQIVGVAVVLGQAVAPTASLVCVDESLATQEAQLPCRREGEPGRLLPSLCLT